MSLSALSLSEAATDIREGRITSAELVRDCLARIDAVDGKIEAWAGDAVVLATGGYSNVFFLSTNAAGCNVTATWRAYKHGAAFAKWE